MGVLDIVQDVLDGAIDGHREHRVEFGENLASISRYYYGSDCHAVDIFQHNRSVMLNVNDVSPGMVLTIPHITHRRNG